jgi:DNA-binding beta-propeller fold protein YncE
MTGGNVMGGTRVAAALAAGLLLGAGSASAGSLIVSANDGKYPMEGGKYHVAEKPVPDTLAVLDASSMPPKLVAEIEVEHSVTAPPTAVALSPDETLALVAAPNRLDPNDKGKLVLDNFLQVVDLEAKPPRVIDRIALPHQPIGVAINKAGTLALAAHFEGELSVLAIDGKKVSLVETLKLGDAASRLSTPVFTPDGRTALVTRRGEGTVEVLAVDGGKVTDTKHAITVGYGPYGMDVAPSGRFAAVANIGRGSGDADSVTLIDLARKPIRAVNHFAVPQTPEGIAFSPDGRLLAIGSINGSNKAKDSPFYNERARLTIFRIADDGTAAKLGDVATGGNTQGVAFTADGKHVIVQHYVEGELGIYRVSDAGVEDTGARIPLHGHPAALRSAPR